MKGWQFTKDCDEKSGIGHAVCGSCFHFRLKLAAAYGGDIFVSQLVCLFVSTKLKGEKHKLTLRLKRSHSCIIKEMIIASQTEWRIYTTIILKR